MGTLTDTYPANFASGKSQSGAFAGASYFILSSGSDIGNDNSIFWEAPSVTFNAAVPEPSSLILFGGVAILVVRRMRR